MVRRIEVRELRKSFGAQTAVAGVSFEVSAGEIFGLLGPNGAGKSTTMHILVGLFPADGGSVALVGQHDPTQAEVRRQIGWVPQALAIYDELTAEQNLQFFGRLYGLNGRRLQDRINWALDFAGLNDRRRSLVAHFSGGMKRRLNLVAALLHQPQILLLDEPTVGVDPQSRNFIFQNIEQLRAGGCAILYTTHYMEEVERLCARAAVMDRGRVLAMDRVAELCRQHGGETALEVEVTHRPEEVAALGGQWQEDRLIMAVADPVAKLQELARAGVQYKSLKVRPPDLEAVFLNLTGRSLRDE
ncbi:MAG: Daunorubicin/doxorubicin resistance ATP-binding protein DrrA [Phycisphaerae bacterium]|nr:Daunorubicin/doxorubicin resistance ATP-binding protein DrrA [Phycisphaerae bacterium]